MNHLSIFTSLKNSDLTCLSAKEAIVNLLGFTELESLQRFEHWQIGFEDDSKISLEHIKDGIQSCYHIINPNKDHVFFDELPIQNAHYKCHIQEKKASEFPKLIKNCQQRGLTNIRSIQHEQIWTFKLSQAVSESELINKVIVTKSFKEGLLVNPLTQDFQLNPIHVLT